MMIHHEGTKDTKVHEEKQQIFPLCPSCLRGERQEMPAGSHPEVAEFLTQFRFALGISSNLSLRLAMEW
jgi:hypothetical protein